MDDMLETMYEANGIGLAAIQVGEPLRIIVLDISKNDSHWKEVDKFDAVIGNPPYQETDANDKSKGGTNLYTKFISKLYKILKNLIIFSHKN